MTSPDCERASDCSVLSLPIQFMAYGISSTFIVELIVAQADDSVEVPPKMAPEGRTELLPV